MPLELSTTNIVVLVLVGLIAIFIAVFFYYYKRHIYHTKHVVPRIQDWVFLEILMPKEGSPDKDDSRPKNEEEKKQLIGIAEQLFTTLSESTKHKINPVAKKGTKGIKTPLYFLTINT